MENKIQPTSNGISQNQVFKLLVIVAALMALLYVAVILSNESKQRTAHNAEDQNEIDLPIETTNLPADKVSLMFPEDLPREANAEVIENSESNANDGATQATLRFESTRSANENYNTYLNYMRSNGWEIANQDNGANEKLLRGKKGYQALQVTIVPNPLSQTQTVTVTLTES